MIASRRRRSGWTTPCCGGLRTHDVARRMSAAFQAGYAKAITASIWWCLGAAAQPDRDAARRRLLDGRRANHPSCSAVTSPQVKPEADRMGLTARIENAGGARCCPACASPEHAREMAEANGWKRLATNSPS